MLRHPYLSPFLFVLFPILFIYSQNAYEAELSEVIIPSLIAAAFTMSMLSILRIFKFEKRRASLIVSSFVFFFFLFGNVVAIVPESIHLTEDFSVKNSIISLGIVVVSLLLILSILIKFKPSDKMIQIINIVGAVLIVMQIIQGGYVLASRNYSIESGNQPNQAESAEKSIEGDFLDIYYFVLDGYARSDVLEDYYQYDNTEFLSFLKKTNLISLTVPYQIMHRLCYLWLQQ